MPGVQGADLVDGRDPAVTQPDGAGGLDPVDDGPGSLDDDVEPGHQRSVWR
jgi:hypothetical protein